MPMFNPAGASGLTIGSTAIASGTSGRLIYDAAGVAGEMSGTSWDDTNRALTLTGATVTTSNPLLNLSQTWNAAGVAFTGLQLNVTNTTSAAGSLLMDLQVGGVSQFKVDKTGALTTADKILCNSNSIQLGGVGNVGLNLSNDAFQIKMGGGQDTILARDAANTLALRNGTAAQTSRVYNSYTDASNYSYSFRDAGVTTANTLTIGTTGLGTGATTLSKFALRINGTLVYDYGVTVAATHRFSDDISLSGKILCNSNSIQIGGIGNVGINLSNDAFQLKFGGGLDTGIARNAAGIIEINNGTAGTFRDLKARNVITNATVVASLIAAATAGAGARSFVTDATATTFLSTVAGGGANKVPVVSDGTNWLIG